MKRRFEEILEECLSAQLEGRRSVEESLSLYPSLALELEPLLRTAENVSDAYEGLNPPSHLLERGRLRFIASATEIRQARHIARGVRGFHRSRKGWRVRHWGMLGSGVAAAVGLVLLGTAILLAGGNDDSSDSLGVNPSDTGPAQFAANFEELKSQLNHVKLRALQGRVDPADLESLRDATSQLAGAGQPPDDDRQEVEEALNEQYAFIFDLADELPEEQVSQAQDVLITTQKAADDLGITNFPSPPSPTDGATETPKEPPTPTDTPTPPAETAAPTEVPTPTQTAPPQTEG
ncbi:MAG TPA: hypothetical protein VFP63_03770 [Dehalococcoidia bacterium]|nr:hypothetical protein [Dehalococcoidia bacterium]